MEELRARGMEVRYTDIIVLQLRHRQLANGIIACFNATTGDIENAPAIDNLPVFGLVEKDGGVDRKSVV